jgi:hypothetical protein
VLRRPLVVLQPSGLRLQLDVAVRAVAAAAAIGIPLDPRKLKPFRFALAEQSQADHRFIRNFTPGPQPRLISHPG